MDKKRKNIDIENTTNIERGIKISPIQRNILIFIGIFIVLLIVFSPMVFQKLRPGGVDVIGSKGSSHQMKKYQEENNEEVYWNSPVFSGMPSYHRKRPLAFSFDKIIHDILDKVVYAYIWLYLIGFIGMFYLLRFFKLGFWESVFGGLGFIFIPHFMSLLNIGHFAKFRPIMYMPIVTFFFISFLNKKNLLWLLGFIFSFSIQIRTQHYQIIFYQIMILVFIGLYYLIKMLVDKEPKRFLVKILLVIGGSLLITAMVAQPLFVTNEYTPYSIRGGTGDEESTGLDMDYATGWSMHPTELLTFIMPRFYGGTSNELYMGTKVEQWHNKRLPTYWGHMPFNQAYDYFSVVLLIFAVIGLILCFKKGYIKVLLGLFILSLFLSFGRHFSAFYSVFFNYVPFFNKFRVPSMTIIIMQFIMIIWAAHGLKQVLEITKNNLKKIQNIVIGTGVALILIGLIVIIAGSSFPLEKAGDASRYEPQVLEMIKQVRVEMLQADALRMILFTLVTAGIILLFIHKKIKKYIFIGLAIIILLVDLVPYVKKAEGELYDPVKLEQQHFKMKSADKAILKDTSYYRVFPITENPFNNNDWSYYHNSIGGYNAAKLRIYQDIVENCILSITATQVPINWNILKMLNTKYIISSTQLPQVNLTPYYYDQTNKLLVYQATYDPKPAWFVGDVITITDRDARFAKINDPTFDPYETAILEEQFVLPIEKPDSSYVKVTPSFNTMEYEIYTDKPALFVASEIYYPAKGGWKAFVDGKEVPIYKTDHILRSIYIEKPGEHEIVFEFSPQTFIKYYKISLIAHIFAFVCLIVVALLTIFNKKKKEKN
ncbi:MAG: hypothetical protein JW794_00470 [Candidatus Cloacimonetes bacterium]|nr:hypothetical protein [Candidatus Cloacimonadota bacterium]